MEIDITDFFKNAEPAEFSASRAELGDNVGRITWDNAKAEAASAPLLTSDDELQALRDHAQSMGFGADVQAYGAEECNALFIQLVSGDMRELESLCMGDDGEINWTEARALSEQGTIGGSIYPCDIEGHESFGRIFYYLGD
jgi:hypothetical protein